jgi:hypothetical protein
MNVVVVRAAARRCLTRAGEVARRVGASYRVGAGRGEGESDEETDTVPASEITALLVSCPNGGATAGCGAFTSRTQNAAAAADVTTRGDGSAYSIRSIPQKRADARRALPAACSDAVTSNARLICRANCRSSRAFRWQAGHRTRCSAIALRSGVIVPAPPSSLRGSRPSTNSSSSSSDG